ncbi:uncharacterized protein LOC127727074 isoform X4 [Mytilus californianus]|uniref:uncharacterized protein LOC127727074 isoform X4 n=1 Tax=Mytilus californianus TaxID=6549 RepID=UPI002244FEE1|nr:uncharacterized protein LOC127727074 isoform X4 [Mytilus californianus]
MSSKYERQKVLIGYRYYNKEHMKVTILGDRYNLQTSSKGKKRSFIPKTKRAVTLKFGKMYLWIVLSFIVLSASMFEASKVSENVLKDNKGEEYDVIDVQIGNTDIAIIQKDGVILADEITSVDKEYSIIKYNGTCNVQFYEDTSDSKTCYEAFEDDVSIPNDTKTEIKEECGELDIAYVKAVHCNTQHGIQKRSCCYYNYLGRCYRMIGWWVYRYYICWYTVFRCY